ncbi:hypothetical protein D3C72_2060050 [compost metagenome]
MEEPGFIAGISFWFRAWGAARLALRTASRSRADRLRTVSWRWTAALWIRTVWSQPAARSANIPAARSTDARSVMSAARCSISGVGGAERDRLTTS